MNPKTFLKGLAMTSLVQVVACLLMIWWIPLVRTHSGFILVSMLAMFLFCGMMYVAARVFANSTRPGLYIQLIMIAVFIKMLLCLALIIGYKKGFNPADQSFIWPFLWVYLTTTVYEVIFLEKVGRQKQTPLS